MNVEDMILISVDDHVVEPPGMFDDHVPERLRDKAPKVETLSSGKEVWSYDGQHIPNIALNAVAGRPKEEYGVEPTAYAEIRPGTYDVDERVKDMSAGGLLASMNFPSFPGFAGRVFMKSTDLDVGAAMVRAYNDWHVDEWCAAHPGRMIPLAIPMLWDPQGSAAEVRRLAENGCHAITFPENPVPLDLPSLHSEHWDPFWAACAETDTVVCMHIGSSSKLAMTAPDAPVDVMITLQPINIVQCAADLVWSPVFRKFPDLRIALSEGGIGWIPYFLDRLDRTYEMHHRWTGQDLGDMLPSDVFRRNIITCFIHDPHGLALRDAIGVENITWECDYPHSDASWPDGPERLMDQLRGVPDGEIDMITHGNAMRAFSFDPFEHRPREACTVGALRSEVEGHDVAIRATGKKASKGRGVSVADVQRRATA